MAYHFQWLSPKKAKPAGERAAPVVAAEATLQDVSVTLRTIGSVQPYNTVSVKSQVDGQVVAVAFKEGQQVNKGDPLFTIDPRPFEAALRQSEANLARDKAMLEKAKADLVRYTELAKKDFTPRQQFEAAKAAAESGEAAVKASQAMVDNARLQLAYSSIRSPIQGRTGSVLIQIGNVVKANDTAPLVVINQTKPIYVSFAVPERHLPEIKRQMADARLKATALPQGDTGEPVAGEVTFVNNAVDVSTGTIQLKATFANADERLTPGQSVNVVLTLATLANAVVVPSPAIQAGQNGQYVYVVKQDMTVERRPVVVGAAENGLTVVQEGVTAGEKVVTEGQLRLTPGARVKLPS